MKSVMRITHILPGGSVPFYSTDPSHFNRQIYHILPSGSVTFYPVDPSNFTRRISHILPSGSVTLFPVDPSHFTWRIWFLWIHLKLLKIQNVKAGNYQRRLWKYGSGIRVTYLRNRAKERVNHIVLTWRLRNPAIYNKKKRSKIHIFLFLLTF